MTEVFEPVQQYIAPDDWASDDARRGSMTYSQAARDLSDSVAIYLALGGKVTEVPTGYGAVQNPLVTSVPFHSISGKMTHPAVAQDLGLSKRVGHWIATIPDITFDELLKRTHARVSSLLRVLATHFGDTTKGPELTQQYKDSLAAQRRTFAARGGTAGGGKYCREQAALLLKHCLSRLNKILGTDPWVDIGELGTMLGIGEQYCKRVLRAHYAGNAHAEWLLRDRRKTGRAS